jgi:uncharacterized membrane protein YbhN (UPF0104 family)
VALAILAVLLARIEPGKVLDQLRLAPWWAMVLPSVLMFGNTVLHSARLWLLLREVPWPRVLRISLLGNFFGILLPSGGGEAVKVLALGRSTPGLGYEQAAAALLATRVLDLVPWAAFLVWAAVGVLPERLPAFAGLAAAGAGALTCGILVSVAALHWGPAGLQRLPVRVARWFAPLARLRANAAPLWVSLVLAFPFAFVNIAVVWAIGRAYGIPLPLPDAMGAIPAMDLVIVLPITISGVGVREGMFVHVLGAWGVAEPLALAIAFWRWSGEIGRAAVGGILFALGDRRENVTPTPRAGG